MYGSSPSNRDASGRAGPAPVAAPADAAAPARPRSPRLGLLLAAALLTGCASPPVGSSLDSAPSLPPVIRVDSRSLATVLFRGVDLSITGTRIGMHRVGWPDLDEEPLYGTGPLEARYAEWMERIGASLLADAGYPVRTRTDLFGRLAPPEPPVDAGFALAGAVTRFGLDTYGRGAGDRTEVRLEVRWDVRDLETRDVRFSTTTPGSSVTAGTSGDGVQVAFERAFRRLLATPELVAALRRVPDPIRRSPAWDAAGGRSAAGADGPFHIAPSELRPETRGSLFERSSKAVISLLGPGGHGTAFIITRRGLALTNHHVVEGGGPFRAVSRSGDTLAVRVLRTDPEADLALVEVACADRCFTIPLAESEPEVAQELLLIGTPVDEMLSYTATRGIVSGLRRLHGVTHIQTDAALNPGSSGGPMIGPDGSVVGIVAWKVAEEGIEGLGFGVEIGEALTRLGITR